MSAQEIMNFNELLDEQKRLVKQQNRTSELLEINNLKLRAAATKLGTTVPNLKLAEPEDFEKRWREYVENKTRRDYAAAGAKQLKLTPLLDERFSVEIDGEPFPLPRRLGETLQALADPVGQSPSPDRFVPWKSLESLCHALAVRPNQPISDHNMRHLIHRLRKVFKHDKRFHPDFVQINSKTGEYRFALQMPPPNV